VLVNARAHQNRHSNCLHHKNKSSVTIGAIKDHTFAYGANGFKGLLENKKAYVIRSSGASYDQPPFASMDFHEPYLRTIFGFLGIIDATFIKVDGHSEEEIGASLKTAKEQIDLLAVEQQLVASGR
jgi:FMN-dependent NADH-azoreductase